MELKPVLLASKVHTYIYIYIYVYIPIYLSIYLSIIYIYCIRLSVWVGHTPAISTKAFRPPPQTSKKYLFAPDIASVSRERKMRSHIYKAAAMESYGTSPFLSGKSWLHNGPWFA